MGVRVEASHGSAILSPTGGGREGLGSFRGLARQKHPATQRAFNGQRK